jgi:Plant ATP synthase F0
MPQLDKVTFFSQFFWTFIIFLGFYLYVYKFFLPKIGRVLLFREKRIGISQQGETDLEEEKSQIQQGVETLVTEAVQISKGVLGENLTQTSKWCETKEEDIQKKDWKLINGSYISSIGEKSLSGRLPFRTLFPTLPPQIFWSAFSSKLKALHNTAG